MRNFTGACAIVLAVSLGGCTTASSLLGGGSLAQSAPQTEADAEKALAIAHLAYQAIGVSLQQAAASGALHGADAATARTLYDKAGAYLDAADSADAAANAQGVFAAVAGASALIAQLKTLTAK